MPRSETCNLWSVVQREREREREQAHKPHTVILPVLADLSVLHVEVLLQRLHDPSRASQGTPTQFSYNVFSMLKLLTHNDPAELDVQRSAMKSWPPESAVLHGVGALRQRDPGDRGGRCPDYR